MLYDMGFVSPDDLVARSGAAAIDQHPILGAALTPSGSNHERRQRPARKWRQSQSTTCRRHERNSRKPTPTQHWRRHAG